MSYTANAVTNEHGSVLNHTYRVSAEYGHSPVSIWDATIPTTTSVLGALVASDKFSLLAQKSIDSGMSLHSNVQVGQAGRIRCLIAGGTEWRARGGVVYRRTV